jgi:hypothetical protein
MMLASQAPAQISPPLEMFANAVLLLEKVISAAMAAPALFLAMAEIPTTCP